MTRILLVLPRIYWQRPGSYWFEPRIYWIVKKVLVLRTFFRACQFYKKGKIKRMKLDPTRSRRHSPGLLGMLQYLNESFLFWDFLGDSLLHHQPVQMLNDFFLLLDWLLLTKGEGCCQRTWRNCCSSGRTFWSWTLILTGIN